MAGIKNGKRVVALHNNKPYVGVIVRPHELQAGYVVKFDRHGEHYVNERNIKEVTPLYPTAYRKAEFKGLKKGEATQKQDGVSQEHLDKLAENGRINQELNAKPVHLPVANFLVEPPEPTGDLQPQGPSTTHTQNTNEYDYQVDQRWESLDAQAQSEMKRTWVDHPEERDGLRKWIPTRVLETDGLINDTPEVKSELERRNASRLASGLPKYMKPQASPERRMTKEQEVESFEVLVEFRYGKDDGDVEMEEMYYSRRSQIVEANLWVAMMASRRYSWVARETTTSIYGNDVALIEMADLYQEAVIGVTDAVEDWDIERGERTRFSSLAYAKACSAIREFISEKRGLYAVPRNEAILAGALSRFEGELSIKIGRRPTLDDMWDFIQDKWEFSSLHGITKKRVLDLWVKPTVIYLDKAITDENGDDIEGINFQQIDLEAEEPDMKREELVDALFTTSGLTQEEHDCVRVRFHFETDDADEAHGVKLVNLEKVAYLAGISNKAYASRYVQSGIAKMQANILRVHQILDGVLDMPNDETTKGLIRSSLMSNAIRTLKSEPVQEKPVEVNDVTEALEEDYERKHGKKRAKPYAPKKTKRVRKAKASKVEAHTPEQEIYFKLFGNL